MEMTTVSVGPFGGEGGKAWDDGIYTGVKQLIIYSGQIIDSIQIEYDLNGQSKLSQKHGGNGGVKNTVNFDYRSEYLLSIWGYYSSDSALQCVQSLTIQTNRKTYGPFGTEKGKYFKFPLTSAKVVGFNGRSGVYLDSIGASVEQPANALQPFILGPFGGSGGTHWDDGIYTAVKQIIIYAGVVVDSIQIQYDKNGQSILSNKHGKSTGGNKHTVTFDYPNEFLVAISGYYSLESALVGLQSITFHSNRATYGPFGTESGNHFTFSTPSTGNIIGKIVGLYGRSDYHLEAIGAYAVLQSFSPPPRFTTVGPFGGKGGVEWDDGKYSGVKQLIIHAGSVIDSIQIEYDNNGNSKWSEKHGKSQGGTKHTVKLDCPNEYLVSIRGHYRDAYINVVVVSSLTIQSNMKTYGPFGVEQGNAFESPQIVGKIVGFQGRSGDWLDSIGAHFQLVEPL